VAADFQIAHVDSGSPLVPTEEPLAQMLSAAHITHEAFCLRRHVGRWSDYDYALGMPGLSLGECQCRSSQRMAEGQCGSTVALPNRMEHVDEVRKRAQLPGAAAMPWLIEGDYGQTCLA